MTAKPANAYGRALTEAEIEAKEHRGFVGGMWDEIGALQLQYLRDLQGLKPHHQFLDIGCGALRGGIPLIRYLDVGHYHGFDINASLVEAGRRELVEANLQVRLPQLLVTDSFDASPFARRFDYCLAHSIFTHLPMNSITRCLVETGRVLAPSGALFATFFEAPSPAHVEPIQQRAVVTMYDSDPYHYAFSEMQWMGRAAQLDCELIGDWGHPRGQRMLVFRSLP